jgi:hypothetical protein
MDKVKFMALGENACALTARMLATKGAWSQYGVKEAQAELALLLDCSTIGDKLNADEKAFLATIIATCGNHSARRQWIAKQVTKFPTQWPGCTIGKEAGKAALPDVASMAAELLAEPKAETPPTPPTQE